MKLIKTLGLQAIFLKNMLCRGIADNVETTKNYFIG